MTLGIRECVSEVLGVEQRIKRVEGPADGRSESLIEQRGTRPFADIAKFDLATVHMKGFQVFHFAAFAACYTAAGPGARNELLT